MKFVPLISSTLVSISILGCAAAFAAANDPAQSSEITALEKKLAATRDELAAVKTALAISKSETEAAVMRAKALTQPDSQVEVLRSEVRLLEQDLRSATAGLQRLAADKAAAEAALRANQQLAGKADARGAATVDPETAVIQTELTNARSRLAAAEKGVDARDAELAELRARLATVESLPRIPSDVAQELAALRRQVSAAADLETRVHQLETEKAALLVRVADFGGTKDEFGRIAAAYTDADRKLVAAHDALAQLTKERDELKTHASRANELEARVRPIESPKANAAPSASEATVSKEEFARVVAAQANAESKLSTVLRSFTLLTKERDELRARLAEMAAKTSANQEKR
jgi:chromosome segregation ATPase